MSLDLDQRRTWPDELKVLLKRFPRETWREQRSATALFWLDVHDGFRRETATARAIVEDYRAGRRTAREFGIIAAPRLGMLVAHLHGHHYIEDLHYFPSFRSADERLAPGIDALAGDHRFLSRAIAELTATSDSLLAALAQEAPGIAADAVRHAADALADASELFVTRLLKHLDDEEDLVIPLMLDR